MTSTRYRSGMAAMRSSTRSVASGSTRFGSGFGSRTSTHGEAAMSRSRTAARKMPATNE
jgi:hypothetical protein